MLDRRQRQAIDLARQGYRQREIAEALGLSQRQVYRLLKEARDEIGVRNNQELIAWALTDGKFVSDHGTGS